MEQLQSAYVNVDSMGDFVKLPLVRLQEMFYFRNSFTVYMTDFLCSKMVQCSEVNFNGEERAEMLSGCLQENKI